MDDTKKSLKSLTQQMDSEQIKELLRTVYKKFPEDFGSVQLDDPDFPELSVLKELKAEYESKTQCCKTKKATPPED